MDARVGMVEQVVPISFAYDEDEPIKATFTYDTTDPYAVTVLFTTRQGDRQWAFARALVLEGLTRPAGDGDVHLEPAPDGQVYLDLYSDEGSTRLLCDRTSLTSFIDQMYASIPEGEESRYVQLDNWLADLCA
jgi:hypothetical protein